MPVPQFIFSLIEKYLSGSATPEERQQLLDWYRMPDNEPATVITDDANAEKNIEQRLLARLHATLDHLHSPETSATPSVHQRRAYRRLPVKISVAASLLLALTLAGYLYFKPTPAQHAGSSAVPSGRSDSTAIATKATLTLASGETLVLDEKANGLLSEENGIRVLKKQASAIAYDGAGQKPTGRGEYNVLSTPKGCQYQVTLSDGSKVWLNAASSLRYPTQFNTAQRRVTVTGEAYFEIASVQGRTTASPFIVQIANAPADTEEVRVLGTTFNVSAYADDSRTQVTLLSGRVQLGKGDANAILKPGQRGTMRPGNHVIDIINDPDPSAAASWKEGRFEFRDNEGLRSIMRKIARWYDIDVEYEHGVNERIFGGAIPRQENVALVLKMLEATGTVHFKIEGRHVTVVK